MRNLQLGYDIWMYIDVAKAYSFAILMFMADAPKPISFRRVVTRPRSRISKVPLIGKVYLGYRWGALQLRRVAVFSKFGAEIQIENAAKLKTMAVSRMYWGRSNGYRVAFHYIVTGLTISALLFGVVSRLFVVEAQTQELATVAGLSVTSDLLQQGSSIQTVLAVDPNTPSIRVSQHIVQPGETLSGLSETYGVSIDTIRWVNSSLISPFSNEIKVGWNLNIPQIDGIFIEVQPGYTVDYLVSRFGANGNVHRTDIIELNRLDPRNPVLAVGDRIFIPSGRMSSADLGPLDIPTGVFTNPLSNPNCAGYSLSRGVTWGHDGLDLARYPGCPIRAIATGDVITAECSLYAQGCYILIDHGGGIISHYYHGDGTFWVKAGDRVQQGQDIMMMGSTGNSTGVHLHLEIRKNNMIVDPALYVPF